LRKLITSLWDKYKIEPVIATRNLWRDGDETRLVDGSTNVVYDYRGNVFCYCPERGVRRSMANGGFEKDRNTLKCLCPAKHYGIECRGVGRYLVSSGIRILLSRRNYKWKKQYKKDISRASE
jgi:hypothetical protein